MAMVKELGSPIERGGYTYFSARFADGSGIAMARVPTSSVTDGSAYQWFTGMADAVPTWGVWTDARTVPKMPGGTDLLAAMDYYPGFNLYVAIEQLSSGYFGGNNEITIFQTATPEDHSSWNLRYKVLNPGTCKSAKRCYAFIGHPELSTASQLVLSYCDAYDQPAGQDCGHIWAGTVNW